MLIKYANNRIDKIYSSKEFKGFLKTAKKDNKSQYDRIMKKMASVEPIQLNPDDYLIIRNRSISAMEFYSANQNFDAFPNEELKKNYASFVKCPIDVDHINNGDHDIIGIVLDSMYIEPMLHIARTNELVPYSDEEADKLSKRGESLTVVGGYIENLLAIDKQRAEAHTPGLVQGILNGEVNSTSMGCSVAKAECSVCGKKYSSLKNVCQDHIGKPFENHDGEWEVKYSKGKMYDWDGVKKLAFEINHGVEFFEDSVILSDEFAKKAGKSAEAGGEGADARAKILEVVAGEDETKKRSILDYVKRSNVYQGSNLGNNEDYIKIGEEPEAVAEAEKIIEELGKENMDRKREHDTKQSMIIENKEIAIDELNKFFKRSKKTDNFSLFKDYAKDLILGEDSSELLSKTSELKLKKIFSDYKSEMDKYDLLAIVKKCQDKGMDDNKIVSYLKDNYNENLIKEALGYQSVKDGYRITEKYNKIASQPLMSNSTGSNPGSDISVGQMTERIRDSKMDDGFGTKAEGNGANAGQRSKGETGEGNDKEPYSKLDNPMYAKLKKLRSNMEEIADKQIPKIPEDTKEKKEDGMEKEGDDALSTKLSVYDDWINSPDGIKADWEKYWTDDANGMYDNPFNDDGKINTRKNKENIFYESPTFKISKKYSRGEWNISEYNFENGLNVLVGYQESRTSSDLRVSILTNDNKSPSEKICKKIYKTLSATDKCNTKNWNGYIDLDEDSKIIDEILNRAKSIPSKYLENNSLSNKLNKLKKMMSLNTEDWLKQDDTLANGAGFERYDSIVNKKELDLSQKSVNLDKYKDLKNQDGEYTGKEFQTDENGMVQKLSKLRKMMSLNQEDIDIVIGEDAIKEDEKLEEKEWGFDTNEKLMKEKGDENIKGNLDEIHKKESLKKIETLKKILANDWSVQENNDNMMESDDYNTAPEDREKQDDSFNMDKESADCGGDLMKPLAKKRAIFDESQIVTVKDANKIVDYFDRNVDDISLQFIDFNTVEFFINDQYLPQEAVEYIEHIDSQINKNSNKRKKKADLQTQEQNLVEKVMFEQWAILSAQKGAEINSQENTSGNEQLKKDLQEGGYGIYPVNGKYAMVGQPEELTENSFFVTNIPLRDAVKLGVKYGQESVLIPEGLYFTSKIPQGTDLDSFNLNHGMLQPVTIKQDNKSSQSWDESNKDMRSDFNYNMDKGSEGYKSVINPGEENETHLKLDLTEKMLIPFGDFSKHFEGKLAELDNKWNDHFGTEESKVIDNEVTNEDSLTTDLDNAFNDEPEVPVKAKKKKKASSTNTNPNSANLNIPIGSSVNDIDPTTGASNGTKTIQEVVSETNEDGTKQDMYLTTDNQVLDPSKDFLQDTNDVNKTNKKAMLSELEELTFDDDNISKFAELETLDIDLAPVEKHANVIPEITDEDIQKVSKLFDFDDEPEIKVEPKQVRKSGFRVNPNGDRKRFDEKKAGLNNENELEGIFDD